MAYSKEFIDKLTVGEVVFILLHEDSHLLFQHPQRVKAGMLDASLSNIAQDMIINTLIANHFDRTIQKGDIDVPEGALFVPKEYIKVNLFLNIFMSGY